jgi:hypothetical protein
MRFEALLGNALMLWKQLKPEPLDLVAAFYDEAEFGRFCDDRPVV